jgi:hypothetical protein
MVRFEGLPGEEVETRQLIYMEDPPYGEKKAGLVLSSARKGNVTVK